MSVSSGIIALAVTLGFSGVARAVDYHINTQNQSDAYVLMQAHLLQHMGGPRDSEFWCVRPRTNDHHELIWKPLFVRFVLLRSGCPKSHDPEILRVNRESSLRETTWTFDVTGRTTGRNPIPYEVK